MKIQLDMYQTLAVAVLVLLLGNYLKKKIYFLQKFCIPAPVIGGLIFAIMTCICYVTGIAEFSFDDTLREVCMVFFFTSVGFQANLKVLKSGGKSLIVFLGLVIVLIILQNLTAVGLAKLLNLNPLIGMCTGSIPMVGGHGQAHASGPRADRVHVDHVVDAVDLAFEQRSHGLSDDVGARAGVGRVDFHLRRGQVGILFNGQH